MNSIHMTGKIIDDFGGDWSGDKLTALREYLLAYKQALKNTSFKLAYIDAFAGSGLREIAKSIPEDELFEDEIDEEDESYRHGSPLIALSIEPPFDAFIFIERDPDSIASLQRQIEERFGDQQPNVKYLQGDANVQLQELTEKNWRGHRAVAFLDPFALQVKWETIEKIAKTKAIDMWLLFPAMAVNRMLTKSGKIPKAWEDRLTILFGEEDWKEEFYTTLEPDMFGKEVISKTPKVFDVLSSYVTKRLASVFEKTHTKPLILRNSTGSPLFLLCFASGSPTGAKIAVGIAQHIINKQEHGN